MRLQLLKNANTESTHKYWFFGPCYSYAVAAEQKARLSYDNLLRLIDDPDVCDPLKFLRERELVHYQRFGDALRMTKEDLDYKNFYGWNPAFDKHCKRRDFRK